MTKTRRKVTGEVQIKPLLQRLLTSAHLVLQEFDVVLHPGVRGLGTHLSASLHYEQYGLLGALLAGVGEALHHVQFDWLGCERKAAGLRFRAVTHTFSECDGAQ